MRAAFVLATAALLSPSVASAQELPQMLVMDLDRSEDVTPDVARTLSDIVTSEVALSPQWRTLSGADIRNMLALEGERQAAGCSSEASCVAEVAGAMGARFAVFGRVSTLGELLVLQLNLFDALKAVAVSRGTIQASSLEDFSVSIPLGVKKLVAKAVDILGKEAAAVAAGKKAREADSAAHVAEEQGSDDKEKLASAAAAAAEQAKVAEQAAEQAREVTVDAVSPAVHGEPKPAATTPQQEGGVGPIFIVGSTAAGLGLVVGVLGVAGAAGSYYVLSSGRDGGFDASQRQLAQTAMIGLGALGGVGGVVLVGGAGLAGVGLLLE